MFDKLYKHRFELFFISLVCLLFGSLFFPLDFYTHRVSPVLFLVNILTGMLFFLKNKKKTLIVVLLFLTVLFAYLFDMLTGSKDSSLRFLNLIIYFLFFSLVTFQIIHQVWHAKDVNRSVIIGLMSGYIALGFLCFFTFFCIELVVPGSYNGIAYDMLIPEKIEDLLYFSYVTITTIGYGDISPATNMSQKASMLFGIIGQFYLVIVTAVVIEKYIRHTFKP